MDSWSLEIALVTRRLREDPETTRSYSGPEGPSLDPWIMTGTLRRPLRPYRNPEVSSLDPEIFDWNPKVLEVEPGGSSLGREIFDWNPKAIGETGGTVLRLPRQDYYWYLFGFRILPLGSWPLSSSYDVFYFCMKSMICLEGAGVGVMTQVPGFAVFHVWRSRILIAPWTPIRLRLHKGFRIRGLWRPDPARMPL
ncbi:hypothetical protein F2Q68_00039208 [Brassica cretica]|uniref:Uncharacterized protein n=1 Tax=Brassica cretica TaxID=69181 RepID=A0A8S9MPH4_BRACR|nr:hypothetical protein F2Q68_00039208 [Brassica cretica]